MLLKRCEITKRNYQKYNWGYCFREPIIMKNIPRYVQDELNHCIGRHAFGDQYREQITFTHGKGKLTMTFTPENGDESKTWEIYNFQEDGIAMGMYNIDSSIYGLQILL